MLLTRIPIVIYYGDFIPATPTANPGQDQWRIGLEMARKWRDAVNKRGGDVTVVRLPEAGIQGNTHFPFSDLNNLRVADLTSEWLAREGAGQISEVKVTLTSRRKTWTRMFPQAARCRFAPRAWAGVKPVLA
jgi:hypothetical protein